jgi:hypothetical protein
MFRHFDRGGRARPLTLKEIGRIAAQYRRTSLVIAAGAAKRVALHLAAAIDRFHIATASTDLSSARKMGTLFKEVSELCLAQSDGSLPMVLATARPADKPRAFSPEVRTERRRHEC